MNDLPPLRLLATFAEVARLGSMQEAAARLNVTRPAVTQALKTLEADIGVTLFDRSRKPARLTEAGQQLAWAVDAGLGQIAAAVAELRAAQMADEMQITLSCTLGMATYWLMPRLPQFYALHPEITVNVQAPPSDLPALTSGIDLALRYGAGNWRDSASHQLFAEEICPVGAPDLIADALREGRHLAAVPLIHVRRPEAHHWASWDEYFRHRDLGRAAGRGQVFDNYVQAVQAALDGRGLMLGWRSITSGLERDGALERWPGGACDLGTGYYLCLRRDDTMRAALRSFCQWIATQGDHAELAQVFSA